MADINENPKSTLSQTKAILAYMREGHTITPKIAREKFGSDRLGARIKNIEKIVGYKPPRKMIDVEAVDVDGNPMTKRVMSYWLEPES